MSSSSLDQMCDAIARRIAARKAAEIHKRVAELLEQEFAESGDTADEPEREVAGDSSATESASAPIEALDVPKFLPLNDQWKPISPSLQPAESDDPDQGAAGGVMIPSMAAKQSGELEAGENDAASARASRSPALRAPADPAAVEGDCGHEPPATIPIPGVEAPGPVCAERNDGSCECSVDVVSANPAPPLQHPHPAETGIVTSMMLDASIDTSNRPEGPGSNSPPVGRSPPDDDPLAIPAFLKRTRKAA